MIVTMAVGGNVVANGSGGDAVVVIVVGIDGGDEMAMAMVVEEMMRW
jgi:hypothetical protein